MATISADVTSQMIKWADVQVRKGLYKSRSEVIREMFRDKMVKENYSLLAEKAFADAWKNEDDSYWNKYLK
ncbi:MAG: type II toxin-antitoxin system ParD family antitoxin [Candidatus Diapherotrites archaeon]|nr:type II toxin-antitoxin system ParD family antitoxin [Candidatus Diapherotrites archaeon]